jgi:hypothetical protein
VLGPYTSAKKVTPFIVDTYGQLGPSASKFIETMVTRYAGAYVTDRTTCLRRFHEQISVALQKGNTAALRAYAGKYVAPQSRPHWLLAQQAPQT